MSKDAIDLRVILDVEQIEGNMFRGHSPSSSSQRVFGGQLVGQAMMAASRRVKHRLANSLQGNFIQGGNPRALAYASDWSLLDTVMARYGRTLYDARMMAASLNHSIWLIDRF